MAAAKVHTNAPVLGSEAVYAEFVPDLITWLIGRGDVVDAQQLNMYTVGATLLSGETLTFALQWQPPRPLEDGAPDVPKPS